MPQKVYPSARSVSNRLSALFWLLLCLLTSSAAVPGQAAPVGLIVHWMPYEQGFTQDTQIRRSGQPSLRCVSTGAAQTTGAMDTIVLNQATSQAILVTGWSKALAVQGLTDANYSIYVDVTYADDEHLWGQTASFATGTHSWQQARLLIHPAQPIRSLNVYALFRDHPGTAWFSGFRVLPMTSSALFDGQPLAPPHLPYGVQEGWFIRDVAANSSLVRLEPGKTTFGLRWNHMKASSSGHIIQGIIRNTTHQSRAITLYYAERFTAHHPTWWNDIRQAESAAAPGEYENVTHVDVGAVQELSLYPFGCVTGKNAGYALALPPDMEPRVVRIVYNQSAHLLYMACDLALTPAGDPYHHDQATMAISRYHVDPKWGFRDAAARYYALFPAAFQRRAQANGIWIPFTNPAIVSGAADFHFAYHEGAHSIVTDHQHSILSFNYVEPMTYWMAMPPSESRTYAAALAQLKQEAAGGPGVSTSVVHQAQAVINSGSEDSQERWNVAFRNTPWCDGAVWVLDPNPRLPHPPDQWIKARLNQAGVPQAGRANQADGEYLDSLEAWADVLDYSKKDLEAAPTTLTFDSDDRPVLPTWYSVYTDAAALSSELHRAGKLLMANTVPWRFSAFASLIDIMGTETDMFSGSGVWQPEPDSIMDLRRTMSYHKPYLLLLNTDFSTVDSAKIALYFQRCLFYGIFPSMFSANAATHPYWEDPALYNRDRPLFKAYIPLIQRLSSAGWEPVTWARTDQPSVWTERYGTRYLTVMNTSASPAVCHLRIDCARFLSSNKTKEGCLVVSDALTGRPMTVQTVGKFETVRLHLRTSETKVLLLQDVSLAQQRRNK